MKESKKDTSPPVSRIQEFIDFFGANYKMILPDCKLSYMLNYFEELGRCKIDGMSELPIDHKDLFYWQQVMKRDIPAWESQLLISMSEYYLSFKNNDESMKPPYLPQEFKDQLIEIQRADTQRRKELQKQEQK